MSTKESVSPVTCSARTGAPAAARVPRAARGPRGPRAARAQLTARAGGRWTRYKTVNRNIYIIFLKNLIGSLDGSLFTHVNIAGC